jgi:hypothetical protein
VSDQNGRYVRIRYTATGALAALAAIGAIAGAVALAANPHAKAHGHPAVANGSKSKSPTSPGPAKTHAPQPGSSRPFLAAAQRLVNDGTITAAEGGILEREIRLGSFDTQTLAAGGFSQTQLQAVEEALSNTKRALAPAATRQTKTALLARKPKRR